MQKYNVFKNIFFPRDKKDWAKCYERTDFWVTIMAGVCLLLSFILARYVDGNGAGTNYSQMWRLTGANWALVMCGILTGICGTYIFVVNLVFKNSATLSGVNIGLGILIAIMFVMEYMILKKVGIKDGGTISVMSNNAGIGFYLGIIGALLFAGLEFYKLGAQGYYTSEDFEKEKTGSGVQIIDGVVVVDGEAIETKTVNENETIVEQSQEHIDEQTQKREVEKATTEIEPQNVESEKTIETAENTQNETEQK